MLPAFLPVVLLRSSMPLSVPTYSPRTAISQIPSSNPRLITSAPPKMNVDPVVFACSAAVGGLLWYAVESWESRPVGGIDEEMEPLLSVKQSSVEGAGLGLFASSDIPSGTRIGSYAGRRWRQNVWMKSKGGDDKKEVQSNARTYIWLLENGDVLDPTNQRGMLEEEVPWIVPGGLRVPVPMPKTLLCRINEPDDVMQAVRSQGHDCNAEAIDFVTKYSIDILVKDGSKKGIAIEVDGPTHFIISSLRYRFITVPFWERNAWNSKTEKGDYISNLMGKHAQKKQKKKRVRKS